jgi:signal transduction histidine kinase
VIATTQHEEKKVEILALDGEDGFRDAELQNSAPLHFQDVIDKLSHGGILEMAVNDSHGQRTDNNMFPEGIRLGVFMPLLVQNRLVGVISFGYQDLEAYTLERTALAQQVANSLAVALQQALLLSQVIASGERLQELAQRVIAAQEAERLRISRELHDESGQVLTALKVQLEILKADLSPAMDDIREQLTDSIALADNIMKTLRALAHGLRPPVTDALGLEIIIGDLCQDFGKRVGLKIDYTPEVLPDLTDVIKITLYRFTQEALTNIARHAQAKNVQVQFHRVDSSLTLTIQDDGVGFDLPNSTRGMGLESMGERLELVGGNLEILTQPGQGTHLNACVPIGEVSLEAKKERI